MSTTAARASARTFLRAYAVDGMPASGANEPDKSEGIAALDALADAVDVAKAVADSAAAGRRTVVPVRTRSTGNVVIASALEDGDTLNGLTLATGDRVFLGSQTAPAENGIYVVPASGAAARATDADTAADLERIEFLVLAGTVGAGETWHLPLAASAITVGTTALAFVQTNVTVDYADEFSGRLDAVEVIAEGLVPDGDNNWFVGGGGNGTLTGTDNVVAGVSAGQAVTTGSRLVLLGRAAGRAITTLGNTVAIGAAAALLVVTGDYNVFVGADAAGNSGTALTGVTVVGRSALYNVAVDEATGIGVGSGQILTSGVRFTAVGARSGGLQSDQADGTFLGWEAGGVVTHVPSANQTVLGSKAYGTAANQVVLGNDDVTNVRLFGNVFFRKGNSGDTFIGQGAGHGVANGNARVFIGFEAGATCSTTSDVDAVAIGYAACGSASQIRASVVIGTKACQFAFNTIDCTVVGDQAGMNLGLLEPNSYIVESDETKILFAGAIYDEGDELPDTGLVGVTLFGKNAGRYITIGTNNTGIGDSALGFTTKGIGNTAIGYVAGEGNVKGSRNTWSGCGCRTFQYSGNDNTQGGFSLGNGIGSFSTPVAGGSRNTNFGGEAVYVWAGSDTASLGFRTLFSMTGGTGGDVAIGAEAGYDVVTGGDNIFIGRDAGHGGSQATDVQNSIGIGAGVVTTADNQVVIGNASNDNFRFGATNFSAAELAALKALVA